MLTLGHTKKPKKQNKKRKKKKCIYEMKYWLRRKKAKAKQEKSQ